MSPALTWSQVRDTLNAIIARAQAVGDQDLERAALRTLHAAAVDKIVRRKIFN